MTGLSDETEKKNVLLIFWKWSLKVDLLSIYYSLTYFWGYVDTPVLKEYCWAYVTFSLRYSKDVWGVQLWAYCTRFEECCWNALWRKFTVLNLLNASEIKQSHSIGFESFCSMIQQASWCLNGPEKWAHVPEYQFVQEFFVPFHTKNWLLPSASYILLRHPGIPFWALMQTF